MRTHPFFAFFSPVNTGVNPAITKCRPGSALHAWIDEAEMTPEQLEITKISKKWAEVRHMSADEIEEPEWKEAHARYFEKYHADMAKIEDLTSRLQKMISPVKIQKKTNGQRKRDAYAKVVAREQARAAKK